MYPWPTLPMPTDKSITFLVNDPVLQSFFSFSQLWDTAFLTFSTQSTSRINSRSTFSSYKSLSFLMSKGSPILDANVGSGANPSSNECLTSIESVTAFSLTFSGTEKLNNNTVRQLVRKYKLDNYAHEWTATVSDLRICPWPGNILRLASTTRYNMTFKHYRQHCQRCQIVHLW